MHAAPPPVRLVCNRGWVWPRAQVALCVAAATVFAVWLAQSMEWALAATAMTVTVAGLLGAAASRLGREPAADLVWDGRTWSLSGQPGEVGVRLDLGNWMLLRFCATPPARGIRWLEVRAAEGGTLFHLWRAALHSPRAAAGSAVAAGG